MKLKDINQLEFSTLFFDTIFGLILFFSLDSFLEIKDPAHFLFYLFSTIIVVHWWLVFRSADDAFGEEVTSSAVDLVFGVIYVILVEYVVLSARIAEYQAALGYLMALLIVDLVWVLLWRYVGHWQTKDKGKIAHMEQELNNNLKIGGVAILLFGFIFVFRHWFTSVQFVSIFILVYMVYIYLTFKGKIIDLKIF